MVARENIGEIDCPFHDGEKVTAFIRQDVKGKLYLYCPECGIISPRLPAFKLHIKKNGTFYSQEPEKAPPRSPDEAVEVRTEEAAPMAEELPEEPPLSAEARERQEWGV